jgi:hypothetical protein
MPVDSYVDYFLRTASTVVQCELLELSHSAFTQTYRIVRNVAAGITVKLETGEQVVFDYYPVKIEANADSDDLDQSLTITLGDLGEILPTELDAVTAADSFHEKPLLTYRTYRSDDLTKPMLGPLVYEIESIVFKGDGCSFTAKAPSLNQVKTGELYTLDRFPMLRAFL